MRVVVIGGGILGTSHAWLAVARGHDVVQVERELQARGASVRNFGLVWVSGRAGDELAATLRSRELWEEIGNVVPGVGFRANGSLTLLRTDAEIAVAVEALGRADSGDRGFKLVEAAEARALNPVLRGEFAAALWCERDAAVESRVALPAIRSQLATSGRYRFLPGREVRSVQSFAGSITARDDAGDVHTADVAIVCPGAYLGGLAREMASDLPVRRVRLQMMQTAPLGEPMPTSIADADSLRYYPGYRGDALDALRDAQPQHGVPAQHRMQLLCVQRLHGGLTLGDTHAYEEPFEFDVAEEPYAHLVEVVEGLLGRALPPIARRWSGVYAETTKPGALVHRTEVDDGLWLVTGPGGRGMTLGPVLAEQTADLIGL